MAHLKESLKTGKPVSRMDTQTELEVWEKLVLGIIVIAEPAAKALCDVLKIGAERKALRVLDIATDWLAVGIDPHKSAMFVQSVLRNGRGTPKMQEIAGAVQEGASAYLIRQFRTLAIFVVIAVVLLFLLPVHATDNETWVKIWGNVSLNPVSALTCCSVTVLPALPVSPPPSSAPPAPGPPPAASGRSPPPCPAPTAPAACAV